eukprot:TRINITY_DN2754_c0_g2_i1.p1 TRINITY_DN2754_c0_g2~~TRINITY_DN2754_c0_g2_i1.p1  ORF type:complete len:197 (-),score=16.62 TRINITY_DN2754_c0_g2_i1:95-685(-)
MPAISWHSATVIADKMFVIGGLTGINKLNEDILIFNTQLYTWERLCINGSSFEPRYSHTAVAFGDHIIIFGGKDLESKCFELDELWVLGPEGQEVQQEANVVKQKHAKRPRLFVEFMEIAKHMFADNTLRIPESIDKLDTEYKGVVRVPEAPNEVDSVTKVAFIGGRDNVEEDCQVGDEKVSMRCCQAEKEHCINS